jgi:hypothetical protein
MTTTHTTSVKDRIGALCGAAYVVLILVGNQLAVAGEKQGHPTGADVITQANREAHRLSSHIGFGMEVLGFVALAAFLAWFADRLARAGAGWLSGLFLVGGLSTMVVKLASVGPEVAIHTERATIDPHLALVLADIGGAAFVVSFVTFGILMLGAGFAVLHTGLLGKATGWSAVILGVAGIALPVASNLDPYDTNPMPFLLGLLWILVVSIRLAVRTYRTVSQNVDDPVAVGA